LFSTRADPPIPARPPAPGAGEHRAAAPANLSLGSLNELVASRKTRAEPATFKLPRLGAGARRRPPHPIPRRVNEDGTPAATPVVR